MDNYLVSAGYLPCKTYYHRVTHLTKFSSVSISETEDIFSSDIDEPDDVSDIKDMSDSDTEKSESFVIEVSEETPENIKFDSIAESVMTYLKKINHL